MWDELPEIPKPKEVSRQELMDIQLAKVVGSQLADSVKPLKFERFI